MKITGLTPKVLKNQYFKKNNQLKTTELNL